MTTLHPPSYIVWSTDQIDLSDPFQRCWYIQQVLTHGQIEDNHTLKLDDLLPCWMRSVFLKTCVAFGSAFWRHDVLKCKGILSDFQKAFLRLFAGLPDQERFYLTGGTALSEYYLGHRLSYDLDLFTTEADLAEWRLQTPEASDLLQVLDFQESYQLSFWDAMIVQSAARLGCKQLLSEDFNHGQMYGNVKVTNPFKETD
jgi:predicted nucleic acid-binding protein